MSKGIDTAVHYPRPVNLQPAYSSLGDPAGTFPHAERACETVLSIPNHPQMTDEQVEYVIRGVTEIVGAE